MGNNVIGIVSFKGGVGKTISTINIGAAMVRQGKKVLLIDGNFLSPTMHIYLGLLELDNTLKEVIRKGVDFRNAVYEHKSGVHLMPCRFYKDINFAKFKLLVEEVRKYYDYVLIDSGPSYTEEIIAILMAVDKIFFVTTPDYPTIASTVRAAKLVKYKGVSVGGVIVNRVRKKRFELKKSEIEKTIGFKVVASIPEDNRVIYSTTKFVPVVFAKPRSKSSKVFMKIAKGIIQS